MWDEERKLDLDEKPLAVQLTWTADNREGRFVLKRDKDSLEVKRNLLSRRPCSRIIWEFMVPLLSRVCVCV